MELTWYLRAALRALAARASVTAVMVAVLALGIGANTAVFSAVLTLLYRPLPLPGSERLVTGFALREGFDPFGTSLLEYEALAGRTGLFESVGLAAQRTVTLRAQGPAQRVQAAAVTANYLRTAGAEPVAGRGFLAGEDVAGGERVALIGHALWQQQFEGGPEVLGRVVHLDGEPYEIIGVMAPGFDLPFAADVWIPLQDVDAGLSLEQRTRGAYSFLGRLRPRVTSAQADVDAKAVARRLEREYPSRRGWTYRVIGLRQQLLGDLDGRIERALAVLVAAVAFLLIICCANVANLLLVSATGRERDVAVRLALGATRDRIARELLVEHGLIALAGGAGGTLVALWLAPLLSALNPTRASSFASLLTEFHVDGAVLAFAFGLSLLTALGFGVAPAFVLARRTELSCVLAATAPRTGITQWRRRKLNALVALEIAVAVVLVVGGGLIVQSFRALQGAELGFRTDRAAFLQLTLPAERYAAPARRAAFVDALLERARSIPGVESAGISTNVPLQFVSFDSFYTVEGRSPVRANEVPITAHRVVTPSYLETLGVTLLRGRLLQAADGPATQRVVVVTEALARDAWPGQDPIGRRIRRGRPDDERPWLTVVGVVDDVKEDRFNFRINRPAWYIPYAQEDSTAPLNLLVRTTSDPIHVATLVRDAVQALDQDVGTSEMRALDEHVSEVTITERFAAVLLSALAAAGLLLAAIGLHAVVSYVVRTRRSEIALRMALGAAPSDVLRMVMREAGAIGVVGVAAGGIAAVLAARGLGSILYDVGSADPLTFIAAAAGVVIVVLFAAYLPARRAARLDPVSALR